ncbi:F0F1 ATP synthase subunit delta [Alteromonas sp. CYL-A6]|uniref:F0F1 ATP synthase subunit delta n=1 Tax=Alteromonas nitratireducens TaxID=3390813 RepID=UPI0034B90F2A
MSELTTVARPYAKAAFDFAVEHSAVDKWQHMLTFAGAVASNEEIHNLLTGAIAAESLAEIFIKVCGEELDEHGQNLIKVLAENKRLAALPAICSLFDAFKADYDKTVDVTVTSASALTDAQQNELSSALEKRLARKVKLNCNVDPDLIAGMIVKAGDTVIDGSVKSKLNRLSDALQA